MPAADGGSMMAPAIILALALLGGLILAVAIVDLKRKRRAEAVAIESQIADALMREPRLTGNVVTTVAHVPLTGRSGLTVEVRGEVEYPELRETAVRIVRQELLRYHPDGRSRTGSSSRRRSRPAVADGQPASSASRRSWRAMIRRWISEVPS